MKFQDMLDEFNEFRAPIQKDLTGLKFGRLTVVEKHGKDAYGKTTWRCVCDCGKPAVVRHGLLQSQHTQSCGCLKAARRRWINRKPAATPRSLP